MKHPFILLFALAALLVGIPILAQDANLIDSCVTSYDSTVDYFPEKIELAHTDGFTVEYFNNYKVVTVGTPWFGAETPLQYVLVQCGTPAPEDYPDAQIVEIPAQSVVSLSTSFLPHLTSQNVLDRLVAVDTSLYTHNQVVIDKVAAGEVAEIGGGGSGDVNLEVLIDLQPGLVLTQRFSGDDTTYPAMLQAGIPAVIVPDFLDASPLGQAEWGKYISLFFNTEGSAQTDYTAMAGRYTEIAEMASAVENRPTVFANTPYNETWYMPGGKSYLAQLLADAGADYLWADDESTGSLFLDFETVFETAVDADYWVNAGFFWQSLNDALAEDVRYAEFSAFQNGNIYSNNARVNANGGSDYFESGIANPDVILADLVRIFHPELLPDHELVYYRQLTLND
ncbi:MAG: ABC transporter substrate-binding protein [Anaerolineaceae bacterium]|nr:ABC transporter substrate-binding protein [Anaerolineaceae bacterium]